jgi:hypothetical protein
MRALVPFDTSIMRVDPNPAVEEYSRERFAAFARPYADDPNTTQLDAMYWYKSAGHFGAYRSAIEAAVRQEMPCYSKPLFEVAFSAHHRWRNGNRLHRGIIQRLDPRVAAVATTHGGPAGPFRLRELPRYTPYFRRLGRAAVRKLTTARPVARPWSPIVAGGYRTAVDELREEGVLDAATMRTADLYDGQRLAALLRDSRGDGFDRWPLLGRIATLELAYRAAGTTR